MAKPAENHRLDGTFRKDRHSDDIKAPMMGEMPPAPGNMNEAAAEWWRKKCIDLQQMGMLYRSDLELLATYCNLLADMDYSRVMMNESEGASQRKNWLKTHNEALKFAMPIAKEFGFSPLARTKIKMAPIEEKDAFDNL